MKQVYYTIPAFLLGAVFSLSFQQMLWWSVATASTRMPPQWSNWWFTWQETTMSIEYENLKVVSSMPYQGALTVQMIWFALFLFSSLFLVAVLMIALASSIQNQSQEAKGT